MAEHAVKGDSPLEAPNHQLRKAVTSLAIGNIGTRGEDATGGLDNGGTAAGGFRGQDTHGSGQNRHQNQEICPSGASHNRLLESRLSSR